MHTPAKTGKEVKVLFAEVLDPYEADQIKRSLLDSFDYESTADPTKPSP